MVCLSVSCSRALCSSVLAQYEQLTQLVVLENPGFEDKLLSQIDRWNHTALPGLDLMLLRH
jgi:hypothetical protein